MKRVKCSGCRQFLGVPEKFDGKKVTCPSCNKTLVISFDSEQMEANHEVESAKFTNAEQSSATVGQASTPDDEIRRTIPAAPAPKFVRRTTVRDIPPPTVTPDRDPGERNGIVAADEQVSAAAEHELSVPKASQPVTARIIKSEEITPELANNGELPTLQLKDDRKPGPKSKESQTSPIFVGILLCGSLIVSGLILVFGDFQPRVDQRELARARQELTKFYSVRIDVPLKPYQIYLREAQLANSRGDRPAEIEAYRKVMKMFRAEDRNKYVGVTGSPTADSELEHLVSIMLGNGRDGPDNFFR